MSTSDTPRFFFVNRSTDKNESARHRELQRSEARAHAARVSSRKARVVKHGTTSKSTPKQLPTMLEFPVALALRPTPGALSRRTKVAKDGGDDGDIYLDKRRFYSPSITSLGQGEGDPFDSAPVKGLNNFIYSILDFGMSQKDIGLL